MDERPNPLRNLLQGVDNLAALLSSARSVDEPFDWYYLFWDVEHTAKFVEQGFSERPFLASAATMDAKLENAMANPISKRKFLSPIVTMHTLASSFIVRTDSNPLMEQLQYAARDHLSEPFV